MGTVHSARPRVRTGVMTIVIAGLIGTASGSLGAQWFTYPSPGAPRTADGKVALGAPTPRLANGKPDLSGVWMTGDPLCVIRGVASVSDLLKMDPRSLKCPPSTATFSRQSINIGIDMAGGLPYQPWLATLVDERTAKQSVDDPHIRCLPDFFVRAYGLPHFLKFSHTPDLLLMLNEYNGTYRQVFTDGRPLPTDPNPSWQGYSIGTWEGDTLVIDSAGFRDDLWLDWAGSMVTGAGRIRERITRTHFGQLEIEIGRRRSEGVYPAVVGHLPAAICRRHRAHRRDLRRKRDVLAKDQVADFHVSAGRETRGRRRGQRCTMGRRPNAIRTGRM